jgi:hypothetical protein
MNKGEGMGKRGLTVVVWGWPLWSVVVVVTRMVMVGAVKDENCNGKVDICSEID